MVAEVQGVGNADGAATLHTRSLRYGKLRNGVFVDVAAGSGRGVGVVRSKRQVFTVDTTKNGGGEVDVALGVNGFVWVSRHVDPETDAKEKEKGGVGKTKPGGSGSRVGMSISNLDELVSNEIYSSQNDEIDARTRTEIARLCACITLLAEAGVKVDEDTVVRAYHAAVEDEMEMMVHEGGEADADPETKSLWKRRVVRAVVGGG